MYLPLAASSETNSRFTISRDGLALFEERAGRTDVHALAAAVQLSDVAPGWVRSVMTRASCRGP